MSDLNSIPPLSAGAHTSLTAGACVMEAASFIAGEAWSDTPECACPVISTFLRSWNDALPDDERDAILRPFITLVLNTRSTPDVERKRAMLAADWLIREHTPAWLRLAGLTAQADALAGLPEITDMAQCPSLMPTFNAVREDAATARAAAWDAAWDAARGAALGAAWDAALDAAWDAARGAALGAAWDAAGGAALDAARGAALGAARGALNPIRLELQASAARLVRRMIEVTA